MRRIMFCPVPLLRRKMMKMMMMRRRRKMMRVRMMNCGTYTFCWQFYSIRIDSAFDINKISSPYLKPWSTRFSVYFESNYLDQIEDISWSLTKIQTLIVPTNAWILRSVFLLILKLASLMRTMGIWYLSGFKRV